jgi:hypothetical protein
MQTIPCSKARVIAFDASNPLDLANEVNHWLIQEGDAIEIVDWSYNTGISCSQDKKQHVIYSMALFCKKVKT